MANIGAIIGYGVAFTLIAVAVICAAAVVHFIRHLPKD